MAQVIIMFDEIPPVTISTAKWYTYTTCRNDAGKEKFYLCIATLRNSMTWCQCNDSFWHAANGWDVAAMYLSMAVHRCVGTGLAGQVLARSLHIPLGKKHNSTQLHIYVSAYLRSYVLYYTLSLGSYNALHFWGYARISSTRLN